MLANSTQRADKDGDGGSKRRASAKDTDEQLGRVIDKKATGNFLYQHCLLACSDRSSGVPRPWVLLQGEFADASEVVLQ